MLTSLVQLLDDQVFMQLPEEIVDIGLLHFLGKAFHPTAV